jgi:mannose-1-phosphate guanylyltransferase/phosphomannomutase
VKAVVMAGGAGSRLRPLTVGLPKPMVPIVDKPVMEHTLGLLKNHGVDEIIVTTQYMAPVIQNYFGDGEAFGLKIHYSIEEMPLGTAGSVKLAEELLDEPFLVMSGDALTDFDLRAVMAFHAQTNAQATLVLSRMLNPLEYGVVVTDAQGRITQFVEKPTWGEVVSDTVNTGIYLLDPSVLKQCPVGRAFDFSQDLFPLLLEQGAPMFGCVASGYWLDVGDHASYVQANTDFMTGRVRLPMPGRQLGGGIWAAGDVEISPEAQIYGPVYLGRGVKLKENAVVHGPSIIGDYSVIDSYAHVDRSVIWRNSYIGERAEIRGAVICRQCRIKSTAVVFEGAVLGDNCVVGEGAYIHPNVRIWPDKEIETGAIVKTSIIWGAHGRRVIFGRYGVTGLVNVDLTPEFAAKLGAAFGAMHTIGSVITVNRDLNKTSRMIKRAIVAGLPAAGVNVSDLENVPIPVARFYTRATNAAGGVHVCLSPYDRRVVDIKFFDGNGLTIARSFERDVERAFFREDFRRVYLDDIGHINAAPEVILRYRAHFYNALDVAAIQRRRFSVVVDYAHASASLVLPSLFDEMKCTVIALNGTLDPEKMSVPRTEFEHDLDVLARITGATQADFGVRFDVGGERIFVVNAQGERMSEAVLGLAVAELALRARCGTKLIVPASASAAVERIAAAHNAQVGRARLDPTMLMVAAMQPDVLLAADGSGHFIFPEFQPVADGLFTVFKLMELLATQDTTLQDVVGALPPMNVIHRTVACPWEAKGRVMRLMNERYKDNRTEQVDGLKVDFAHEWALVRPDPDEPLFHVYAESSGENESIALCEKFVAIVVELRG